MRKEEILEQPLQAAAAFGMVLKVQLLLDNGADTKCKRRRIWWNANTGSCMLVKPH